MPMVKQPLTIEHALLGFVRRQPMYGYEIHQRLLASAELGLVWTLKQSVVYAMLTRMEADGLLRSEVEPQGFKPARKMLYLTPKGEAAFQRWVSSPVEHGRDFRQEFLAKIYFAHLDSPADALELTAQQRELSLARLQTLRQQAHHLEGERSYDWLVLRFRVGQIEAAVAWLDECADWLSSLTPNSARH